MGRPYYISGDMQGNERTEVIQRRATAQSRGANAMERAHMSWLKERQICAACGAHGYVICHHMYGSAAKKKVGLVTVQIGNAAVLGLCQCCDNIVTRGSRRKFVDAFGPQSQLWYQQYLQSPENIVFPDCVIDGILAYE